MRFRRCRAAVGDLSPPQVRAEGLRKLCFTRAEGVPSTLCTFCHPLHLQSNPPPVKRRPADLTLHATGNDRYSARLRRDSSVVERILGKAEVQGSNPCRGTMAEGFGQPSEPL